jgi:uncharacterized RDD family membrane protein YckC
METAGVFRRAIAVVIDGILLMILGWLIALGGGTAESTGFHVEGAPAALFFLIAMAYYVVMEKTQGATLGKKAMGLKVVRADGSGDIDWPAAIIRNVMRIIDGFAFYLVAAITVWISKNRQRFGDMAAKTLVVKLAWAFALLPLALAAIAPGDAAAAGAPRYENVVVSDSKGGAPVSTFKPATAKIFVDAQLEDVRSGSKARSDWIAVDTGGAAPANYKIATTEMKVGGLINHVTFSFSKPNAGWPAGDYRVDLFIDGKPAGQAKFKVVK